MTKSVKRKLKRQHSSSYYQWRYLYVFLCIITFFLGIGFGMFYYYSKELPPLSELDHYDMKVGSEVFDRNDRLIHTFAFEHRTLTDLTELPPHIAEILLCVEDTKFQDHWGVDLVGFMRSIVSNIQTLSFSQGASTITQQLARNLFLSLDKTIPRKIKEMMLAVLIEQNYSKEEIMEMYLNKVPFGTGTYGIESASGKFFGKEAKNLTISETATLIGLIQLPNAYSPKHHPQRALWRKNIVLQRLKKEKVIDLVEYNIALEDSIRLVPEITLGSSKDYFIEHIRPILERKYGTHRLFGGGLKIYTTLDGELQAYADTILNRELIKFEEKNNYEVKYNDFPADTVNIVTDYVQGGVLSIEPETGYVRVLVGGRNFNHSKLNRMMQSNRLPGSSFKPILYTTALDNGYTPATVIKDEPICFIECDSIYWKPHNYSRKSFGYLRMREALTYSRNIWAIKMLYDLTPRRVKEYARRFGITTPIWEVYSMAIGTNAVLPFELISGYTTFPNNGERVQPVFIRRIEDSNGNILEENKPEKIRVVNEQVAWLMTSMMQSVTEEGTGAGIRWRGYKWAAGGKTGTTDDFRDAWFIGYNRKLVTGVWVGFDNNETLGNSQSGAVAALPAWPYIMKKAIELDSPVNNKGKPIIDSSIYEFEQPGGIRKVTISKETGLLPRTSYEETIEEYFISGTEPTLLSDSLAYNFLPTIYRENNKDSLVYDLGGYYYKYPDTPEVKIRRFNPQNRNEQGYYPRLNLKNAVDSLYYYLNGSRYRLPGYVDSLIIERNVISARDSLGNEIAANSNDAKVFSYGDSISYRFKPAIFAQSQIDSVFYYQNGDAYPWPADYLCLKKKIPKRPDLRGAQVYRKQKPVEIPDSLLYWMMPDSLQSKPLPDSEESGFWDR
ncbi:MAG: PBP1A family penicillin-binding protein [Candidatus Cloacimonetes bacterium]|nr:PBP1A family penicillin-binding protein [Candidatus Cloacimonadota bacterium]